MNKKIILSITALIIILSSCNEAPTEIGFPFINDTISVEAVSSVDNPFIVEQKVFKQHSHFINMAGFLIGKSCDYQAMTFIRFVAPKDTFQYITPDKIISSKVKLKALNYVFGDANAPLSFSVYDVTKLWSPKTSWDSVSSSNGDYINLNRKIGEFNSFVPVSDSGEFIYFDLDKEVTSEWMKYGDDTTKYINKGIVLLPDANSKNIRKFDGPTISPDPLKYFYSEVNIVFYNATNQIDSIKLSSAMEYSLSDAPADFSETDIVLQGAVQYNTELHFDLSSLPENIAIHSASLEMKLDLSKSKLSNYNTDSLRDNDIIATYRRVSGADTSTIYEKTITASHGHKSKDFISYNFEIFTFIVEQWMLRDQKKGIVMLSKAPINNLYNTIDRYIFHGINDPDVSLRPKLKIVYSVRPSYNQNKKGAK